MSNYIESMQKLFNEHSYGLEFATEISKIAKEGDNKALRNGIEKIKKYNTEELELHFQYEEQAILGPLIKNYPEHIELCVAIGKEHGYIRSLVENMSIETARKDLADFGHILNTHTLLENEKLFPIIKKSFTTEQLNVIANFIPLQSKSISDKSWLVSNSKNSNGRQNWLLNVLEFYNDAGKKGGSIILLPKFDPGIIEKIANQTGLEFFNYQQEIMQEYGQDADSISLNQLKHDLRNRAKHNGIVAHNVEALLCVKSEQERRDWLQEFLNVDWPNPIFIPITIFQADVPNEHHKICDLELHKI